MVDSLVLNLMLFCILNFPLVKIVRLEEREKCNLSHGCLKDLGELEEGQSF
jgi:hypothetical protein